MLEMSSIRYPKYKAEIFSRVYWKFLDVLLRKTDHGGCFWVSYNALLTFFDKQWKIFVSLLLNLIFLFLGETEVGTYIVFSVSLFYVLFMRDIIDTSTQSMEGVSSKAVEKKGSKFDILHYIVALFWTACFRNKVKNSSTSGDFQTFWCTPLSRISFSKYKPLLVLTDLIFSTFRVKVSMMWLSI